MPSLDGGVIQHLKGINDACFDGHEAGSFDVHHQHEVIFATCECRVDGGLFCTREWRSIHVGVKTIHVDGSNVDRVRPWING